MILKVQIKQLMNLKSLSSLKTIVHQNNLYFFLQEKNSLQLNKKLYPKKLRIHIQI